MTMLTPAAGDDALADLLTGLVATCASCGRAEGELECEGCGERLCLDCWGEGDDVFCAACLVEGPESRPVEIVPVREGYL